jgi:hypothetical protein
LPAVKVRERFLRRAFNKTGEEFLALVDAHAFDRCGMRGNIECIAVVCRIMPDLSPSHGRQRGTLLWCHQFRVDLVARVCIAVHGDEATQFLFLRVRQPIPGQPGRCELSLPPLSGIIRADSTEASAGVNLNELSVCQSWFARLISASRWVAGTSVPSGAMLGMRADNKPGLVRSSTRRSTRDLFSLKFKVYALQDFPFAGKAGHGLEGTKLAPSRPGFG